MPYDEAELASADVVIVLVDHPDFDPATIARHATLVIYTKNLLRDHELTVNSSETRPDNRSVRCQTP